MANNEIKLVIEGRMNYEEEWTELDEAVNEEHAKRLLGRRMDILKGSDKKYRVKPNDSTNEVNVFYNYRLQRIYRVREKNA